MLQKTSPSSGYTLVFVYGEMRVGRTLDRALKRAVPLGMARSLPSYAMFDMDAFPAMVAGGKTAVTGELRNLSTSLRHIAARV
jgi:gamma-glutamylcyclotransferase (GGCT)/AIG2-like uncharacterized protein YtfP